MDHVLVLFIIIFFIVERRALSAGWRKRTLSHYLRQAVIQVGFPDNIALCTPRPVAATVSRSGRVPPSALKRMSTLWRAAAPGGARLRQGCGEAQPISGYPNRLHTDAHIGCSR